MALPSRDRSLPKDLGPYRLEARLGKGGMGEVYRAYDERLRRRVAIKHVLAKEADKANIRQRFRREARTVARLNHPAVVQIYDILETDDGDWIVMELVEGRTVRDLMDRGEIDLKAAIRLAREVASGLSVAHDNGVVHRDLKVENVMVTEQGRAKILDFGLAKNLEKRDPSDTTLSGSGVVIGTFRAMSPEQIMERQIDARSDLFSLGTMLYEMCTGESPFRANNVVTTMTRVCRHRQPAARSVNPEIPDELSELIDQLLEKDPDKRPQSALEVVRFLDRLTGEITVPPPLDDLAEPPPPAWHEEVSTQDARTEPMDSLPAAGVAHPGWDAPGAIALRTLLATETCDAADLVERLGGKRAAKALHRLSETLDELLARFPGHRLGASGPTHLLFERPAAAVELALAYHRRAQDLAEKLGAPLCVRTAVHLGEVVLPPEPREGEEGGTEAEGFAAPADFAWRVARGVLALARPGQILLTQSVDELVQRSSIARLFGEDEPAWKDHGPCRLPGLGGEVIELFQVGFAGDLAMTAPPFAAETDRRGGAWRKARFVVAGTLLVSALALGALWFRACAP